MKIVICTGGYDPVHSGHIAYFKAAKSFGDRLIVGINSDEWLARKKGRAFMPWQERFAVVSNLAMVDEAIAFDDSDGSGKDCIIQVRKRYPHAEIIFANGGDRTDKNIPEMDIDDPEVKFAFGIGGFNKANSSSWILEEWKSPKTERPWGYYRVLHEAPGIKVKELTVNPGQSLSMQRHQHRAEYWLVAKGRAKVNLIGVTGRTGYQDLELHDEVDIPVGDWHQLCNPHDTPLQIVEIQYGERCDEEDIERKL